MKTFSIVFLFLLTLTIIACSIKDNELLDGQYTSSDVIVWIENEQAFIEMDKSITTYEIKQENKEYYCLLNNERYYKLTKISSSGFVLVDLKSEYKDYLYRVKVSYPKRPQK